MAATPQQLALATDDLTRIVQQLQRIEEDLISDDPDPRWQLEALADVRWELVAATLGSEVLLD